MGMYDGGSTHQHATEQRADVLIIQIFRWFQTERSIMGDSWGKSRGGGVVACHMPCLHVDVHVFPVVRWTRALYWVRGVGGVGGVGQGIGG